MTYVRELLSSYEMTIHLREEREREKHELLSLARSFLLGCLGEFCSYERHRSSSRRLISRQILGTQYNIIDYNLKYRK